MTINFDGLSSDPTTPATGRVKLFARNDTLFSMNDQGDVFAIAGGISRVPVTSIMDPSTELNAISGAASADLIIAFESNVGADDVYTVYAWDPSPPGAENVPFTVDGGSGGRWIAIAGRFQNQSIESAADRNFIKFFFDTFADLPSPTVLHGAMGHVHDLTNLVQGASMYYAHENSWRLLKDHNADDELELTPGASVNIDFARAGAGAFTYQSLTLDQDTTLTESNAQAGQTRLLRIGSGTPGQTLTFPGNWTRFGSYDSSGTVNLIRVECVSPTVAEIQAGSPPAAAYIAIVVSRTRGRGRSQTGLGDSATDLLTVNVGDAALLDIKDSEGQIENRSDLTNIFPDSLSWSGLTAISLPNLATAPFTNIYIVETFPGSGIGEPLLDNVPSTAVTTRTRILLGTAVHQSGTFIENLLIVPVLSYDTAGSVVDLFTEFGDRNIRGNVYSANGANRLLNKSAGIVFGRQINITTTALDPHRSNTPIQVSIAPYAYSRRDGVGGFTLSSELDIDTDFFDDGSGTLAAIPSGRFVHNPIHFDPRSGVTILEYGQTTYASLDEAIDGINQNGFDFNTLIDNIEITTWIIFKEGAANLSDTALAQFTVPLEHAVPPSGILSHTVLTDVTTDQHHAKLHASDHSENADDEIFVENLGATSTNTTQILQPDGSGGTGFISPVREVFAAADPTSSKGDYAVQTVAANGSQRFSFRVPADFVSLVSLEMILIPDGTVSTVDIDLSSDYAAIGQTFQTHSEVDTTSTFSFTTDVMTATSISSVFSSLAAGDYCGILWDNNGIGTTLNMLGIRLIYNA